MSEPRNAWAPFPAGGVLDESITPVRVGGSGLTDGINFLYTRDGAWGKRSGTKLAYTPTGSGPYSNPRSTGVRWYRAAPSHLTQLVIAAQGALWTGNDSTGKLTKIYTFQSNPQTPIRFTSAYDPQAREGAGGDILIICGATTLESFAEGTMQITGAPSGSGGTVTVTIGGYVVPDITGNNAQTYTILQTDKIVTIAQAIVDQINSSKLVQPNAPTSNPTLGYAYVTEKTNPTTNTPVAVIHIGALNSGTGMNGTAFSIVGAGGGLGTLAFAAIVGTLTGGGQSTSGPLKYDGDTVSGLSYQIGRPFRSCMTWHDHVWFWNDPSAINTLFAADIDQPEGFTFMNQTGGYKIGLGDGDPGIKTCKPLGNTLAVYKTNNIYQVAGYDFQTGEYEFQVSPWISGFGVPTDECVAQLNNTHIIWTGKRFGRLAPGSYVLENIGATIPRTSAAIHKGLQKSVQAVGGDFEFVTGLNGDFFGATGTLNEDRTGKAFFAVDATGDGIPDFVLVFDDEATQRLGKYAWLKWNNLPVAAWIPFGQGANPADTDTDNPYLYFLAYSDSGAPNVYRLGGTLGKDDGGAAIPWMTQAGYVTTGSFEITKNLHRVFTEMQSTADTKMTVTVTPGQTNIPGVSYAQQSVALDKAKAPAGGEAYNVILGVFQPQSKTNAWIFQFTEDGTAGSDFELVSYALDLINETIMP